METAGFSSGAICCVCVEMMSDDYYKLYLRSSIERQKGLTTSHMNTQLDPFTSKLMIYVYCIAHINKLVVRIVYVSAIYNRIEEPYLLWQYQEQ